MHVIDLCIIVLGAGTPLSHAGHGEVVEDPFCGEQGIPSPSFVCQPQLSHSYSVRKVASLLQYSIVCSIACKRNPHKALIRQCVYFLCSLGDVRRRTAISKKKVAKSQAFCLGRREPGTRIGEPRSRGI